MLFDAHWHAFRVFGGVRERGIYDNMKTAVDRVGRGKERQVNLRFLATANHYVFEPEFCNPAAGWEKGQVEKNVQDSRHQVLQGMPGFPDLATMNTWLEQRCLEVWQETPHGTLPGTIADVWAEERAALMPLPSAFDGFIELSKRVSPKRCAGRLPVEAAGQRDPVGAQNLLDQRGRIRGIEGTRLHKRPAHGRREIIGHWCLPCDEAVSLRWRGP
jgi:hypothetical protein